MDAGGKLIGVYRLEAARSCSAASKSGVTTPINVETRRQLTASGRRSVSRARLAGLDADDAVDFSQLRDELTDVSSAAHFQSERDGPFLPAAVFPLEVAARRRVVELLVIALGGLKAGLLARPIGLDANPVDGELVLRADGEDFAQDSAAVPIGNAQR